MFYRGMYTYLFIFTFIQIQLSWRRDEITTHKPWMVLWKGYANECSVETGNDFFFHAYSIKYGYPLINATGNFIRAIDRTEIEINTVMKVYGPPLSFHRIAITLNGEF